MQWETRTSFKHTWSVQFWHFDPRMWSRDQSYRWHSLYQFWDARQGRDRLTAACSTSGKQLPSRVVPNGNEPCTSTHEKMHLFTYCHNGHRSESRYFGTFALKLLSYQIELRIRLYNIHSSPQFRLNLWVDCISRQVCRLYSRLVVLFY